MQFLILVRPEPPGQFTARAVGIPEATATAATREAALGQVRDLVEQWVMRGELVTVSIRDPHPIHPLTLRVGRVDPNDPMEQAYLEELARMKREDLEERLRELGEECPNSSSTPTT